MKLLRVSGFLVLAIFFVLITWPQYKSVNHPAARVMQYADLVPPSVSFEAVSPDGASIAQYGSPPERVVVRTARMKIEVAKLEEAANEIRQLASRHAGSVPGLNITSRQGEIATASASLRLPVGSLDSALAGIRHLALNVEEESMTEGDFGEELSNILARIRTRESDEKRLDEIRKGAKGAADLLQIEKAFIEARGEIESLKGRRSNLERRSAQAEIYVVMQESSPSSGMGRKSLWSGLLQGVRTGLDGCAATFVAMITFTLTWLPALVAGVIGVSVMVRFRRSRAQK